MKHRVFHTIGALALIAIWTFVPVGGLLGYSEGLVRLLTALGLLAGTSAGWLAQHTLHRPMTRSALTGAGWPASGLLFVGLFSDAITGPSAPANVALIVVYTGTLAWALRLLLNTAQGNSSTDERTRSLLVGISATMHACGIEAAERSPGQRTTPVTPLVPHSASAEPEPALLRVAAPEESVSRKQKAV